MKVIQLLGFGFESNVYLIEADVVAVIDAGTGFYMKELIEEIREHVDLKDIEYIILSHEHFDHCGGVKKLKEACNAKVCIHEKGANVIENGLNWSAAFFNAEQPRVKADIKLKDGDEIDLGSIVLKVIYTPGHSEGSICLYEEKSKSLFSGDTIFAYGGIGRTDFIGGDRLKLIESIRKLKKFDVKNLYPGHGNYILEDGYSHIEMAERSSLLF